MDDWGPHFSSLLRSPTSVMDFSVMDFSNFPDDRKKDPLYSVIDYNADGCEIDTSVNVNEEKPEDNDQKPQKGMVFSSVNEAEEYYRNHANQIGFTVRKGKIYKLPDGTLKWRRFLCSCEGFRVKKQSKQGTKYQRTETRKGCQAYMQVTFDDGQWVITKLELEHNHSLKNSNESLDNNTEDTLTGPSEKLDSAWVAEKVCPKHQLNQVKPQAVDSTRAKGETSLAPAEAKDRDKTLRSRKPAQRVIRNLTRILEENDSEQLVAELTKLKSLLHLHTENQGCLPQQTQEDSASSYSEQSTSKGRDEVETPCNYVQNASDQLTLEGISLPVAESTDEEFGQLSFPTIYLAQVHNTNDASHGFGGCGVGISPSTVPIPTIPITTMTSASVAGSSSPHLPCPQGKSSRLSREQGKQCTSFGRVNTIGQGEGCGVSPTSESIWQQILTKYGDITAKCTLKSPTFSPFVKQSILNIVEEMQNNTAHSLSSEKMLTIEGTLRDLESVQVKVDWLNTRFLAVGHLIDYAKAKDNRDTILSRINAMRAEVAQLQLELDQAEAGLQQRQQEVPKGLTLEDTLDKGLL